MKKGYQAILYILLILIIAGGLLLFLWRDNALVSLNENTGISDLETVAKTTAISKDTLDTSILNSTKFVALKNNVSNFEFEAICKGSAAKTVSVVKTVSNETATSTATSTVVQNVGCLVGNNIPFPVPVKKID